MSGKETEIMEEKKPRIGFMVGNYHTDHPTQMVANIWKLLKEYDLDAQIYIGTESSSFITEFEMEANRFDYQYSSLYGMSKFDALDGIIVAIGTMTLYQTTFSEAAFLAMLPEKKPVILTGNDYQVENGASLITDNYNGIYRCVEHLIQVHHCRKIGYVSGEDRIREAYIRKTAVQDALRAHNMDLPEDMIAHGDFSEHVDQEVERLFERHPDLDAVVCANDEMAISVYRICRKRGIEIGKDLAVTGFDDMVLAQYLNPPLTTARQDYDELAETAFHKILKCLRGEKPASRTLEAPFVCRCSCGCDWKPEEKNHDSEQNALVKDILSRRQNQRRTWISALLARELLIEAIDVGTFFEKIGSSFSKLNLKSSYICLLEETQLLKKGEVLQDVDDMLLMMHQTGDSYQSYDLDSAPRFHKDDRTSLVEADVDSGIYMTFLLFYEECVYGTMSVEIEPEDIDFYYAVSLEVGSSLRYLQLSLDQQRYRAELQAIARHDDLTGVYNRSGFMSAAAGYVALHEQETFALVMADLDHLKEINDCFGHLEGDSAICECSRILKEVLGKHSPLGRLGGDEFIGIMSVRSNEDIRTAIELIRRKCKVYNQSSDKPYLVEISAGCVPFSSEEFGQFDSIQRKADLQLYAAKELRRPSSIRSQGQR